VVDCDRHAVEVMVEAAEKVVGLVTPVEMRTVVASRKAELSQF
jgi:hypothetical protein